MTAYLSAAVKNYFTSYSGLSYLCWQGIILSFIESTMIGVYYFFPLYFVSELHINIATAGVIISFYGMGTILGGFLGGKLSDKISPGTVSTAALFFQAIMLLCMVKLQSAHLLMLDLFLMGVASYSFITGNYLWVLSHCEGQEVKRLKAINILGVASNLGLGLSAMIISSLADYDFRSILFLCSLLLICSAGYFSFLNCKEEKTIAVISVSDANQANVAKANKKVVWLVLACSFLVGLIIFQSSTTYSFYIKESFPEYGIKGVGFLFSLNCFMVVLLQTPIGSLAHRYNKILVVGVGAFLLGSSMFLLNFPWAFAIAILSAVIHTLGEMIFFSVSQLICYQYGGEKKKGQSLGLYRMIYASSRMIAPAGGSFIYQRFGGRMLWYLCGLIGITCLAVCGWFRKEGDHC